MRRFWAPTSTDVKVKIWKLLFIKKKYTSKILWAEDFPNIPNYYLHKVSNFMI